MTLKEALTNEEIAKKCEEAQSFEDVLAQLKAYGIETTKEEIVDALAEMGEEITDDELESVAGGIMIERCWKPNLSPFMKWIQERELLAKLPKFMVPPTLRKKYGL